MYLSVVKRYETVTYRLNDFKPGMGVVVNGDKDRCDVGRPQVAIVTFSSY